MENVTYTPVFAMNSSETYNNATQLNIQTLQRKSQKDYIEYKIGYHLALYFLPIIILLGTIGNILTFVVLIRKRMRNTSVNVYLIILACADTGALYFSGFKTWLRLITHFELLHTSNVGCKSIMFLFLISLHMSAWLVVAISADRFMAVWFPLKSLTLCSVKRARVVSLIGFITLSLYNAHVFWTMHLVEYKSGRYHCAPHDTDVFMMIYYPWIKLTTYSCLPFILVLILNVLICVKIIPGFRLVAMKSDGDSNRSFRSTVHKDSKITSMLVIVSLSWLLLTGPFTLWTFLAKPTRDPHEKSKDFLAKIVCFLLMYINHGINFYLYCITGKRFRKELKDMIHGPKNKRGFNNKSSFRTMRTSLRNKSTVLSTCSQSENLTLCQSSSRLTIKSQMDTYN